MDVIKMTRELGKAIQADVRMIRLDAASRANDEDEILQEQISSFGQKRAELNSLMSAQEKDDAQIKKADAELKQIYASIMSTPSMVEFNEAKHEIDQLMNYINYILRSSVNGIDPDTVQEPSSCGGSCSSCAGC